MVVKELMTSGVVTVEPNSSAALAARLLARHNVGALPVCGPDLRQRGIPMKRHKQQRPGFKAGAFIRQLTERIGADALRFFMLI